MWRNRCRKYVFYETDFVTVKAKVSGSDTLVECSCATFATGVLGQGQSSCCHSRLFKETVKGFESTRVPSYINKFKIQECQELTTSEVVVLPSKSVVQRFSIKLEESA